MLKDAGTPWPHVPSRRRSAAFRIIKLQLDKQINYTEEFSDVLS